MKLKKLLALLLALAMFLTSFSFAAADEYDDLFDDDYLAALGNEDEETVEQPQEEHSEPVAPANEGEIVEESQEEQSEPVDPSDVTVDKYSVIIDADNGTDPVRTDDLNGDDYVPKPATPEKYGYTLVPDAQDTYSWKTSAGNGVVWTEGGKSVKKIQELDPDGDRVVTLKAQWTANSVAVTFDKGAAGNYVKAATWPENRNYYFDTKFANVIDTDPECVEGYTFKEWSPASVDTDKSMTATAQWTIHKFDIEYEGGVGGEAVTLPQDEYDVDFDTEISVAPTWQGYTFTGWSINGADPVKTFKVKDSMAIDGVITAVAQWAELTVTFKVDGEQYGQAQKVGYGEYATKPTSDPVKKGYNFVGWYLDGATTSFDFSGTKITKSIVLNAKFEAKDDIPVTFESEAGGPVPEAVKATFDQAIGSKLPKVPEVAGKKDGYWYVRGDETKKAIDANFVITEEEVTLVACYDDVLYTVSFVETKGSKFIDDTPVATISGLKYGNMILPVNNVNDIPNPKAENTTYILPLKGVDNNDFIGWYYDDDNKADTPLKPLPEAGITLTNNLTLVAYWNCYYTITFVNEGPNGYAYNADKHTKAIKATVGVNKVAGKDTITLAKNGDYFEGAYTDPETVAKKNYFDGWFIGEDEFFFDPAPNSKKATVISGDTTITASWYDLYKVTFDFNGATGGTVTPPEAYVPDGYSFQTYHDRTGAALLPTPTKTNTSFIGWKLNGDLFDDDDIIEGNITIVADFGVVAYEVTVDPNGGNIDGDTEPFTKKVTDNHTWAETWDVPADPVYTDHIFVGWFTGTETAATQFKFKETPITAKTTVWAKWSEAQACIGDPEEQTADTLFETLVNAVMSAEEDDVIYLLKDITLEAGTYQIPTSVTIDLNGKTLSGSNNLLIDASDIELNVQGGKVVGAKLKTTSLGKINLLSGTYEKVTIADILLENISIGSKAYFDEDTAKALAKNAQPQNGVYMGGYIPAGYGLKKTATSSGYYVLVKVYTLTFDMNIEDQTPADVTVNYPEDEPTVRLNVGTKEEPKDPVRTDYYLLGWYKEAACKNEFTFGELLTANTTVYAKWGHSVTYYWTAMEGDKEVVKHDEVTVEDGKKVIDPGAPEDFDKAFEFWGYQVQEGGKWTQFDFDEPITKNWELTAKGKWTVTFDPDNGSEKWEDYVTDGAQVTVPENPQPATQEFTFIGWYKGDALYDFTTPVTGNMTLKAVWNNSNWVIGKTFDAVATIGEFGGFNPEKTDLWYSGSEEKPIILSYNQAQTASSVLPTEAGYFVGYQFEAPSTVTKANLSQYAIYYNGGWKKLSEAGIVEEDLSPNGHVVINMFEEVQLNELKTMALNNQTAEGEDYQVKTFEYRFGLWAERETNYVSIFVHVDPSNVRFEDPKKDPKLQYDIVNNWYIFNVDFDTEYAVTPEIKSQQVESMKYATKPANPYEEHHLFMYWTAQSPNPWDYPEGTKNEDVNWRQYKDLPAPTPFEFATTPITKDTVLYAYWVDAVTMTFVGCNPDEEDPTKDWSIQLPTPTPQSLIGLLLTFTSETAKVRAPEGMEFAYAWNESESGQLFAQAVLDKTTGDIVKWVFERDSEWVLDYDMTLEPVYKYIDGATVLFQDIDWNYAKPGNDRVIFKDSYPAEKEVTIDNHPEFPGEIPESQKFIGWSEKRLDFDSLQDKVYEDKDWTKKFAKNATLNLYAHFEDRFLVNFYTSLDDAEPIATLGFMDRGTHFEDLTNIPDGPAGPEGKEFADWQVDIDQGEIVTLTLEELIENEAYIDYNMSTWIEGHEEEGEWVDGYQEIKMYAKFIPSQVTLVVMDGDKELYTEDFEYDELTKEEALAILEAEQAEVVIPEGHEFVAWVDEDGVDFATYAEDWTLKEEKLILTAEVEPIEYTITFVDDDEETVLGTVDVPYGETPVYPGEELPTKEPTQQYTYTFDKWVPDLVPVTGEATYVASYTATLNEYTVTFMDEEEEVLGTVDVPYGEVIPTEDIPAIAAHHYWTANAPETWETEKPEEFDFAKTAIEDALTLYDYDATVTVTLDYLHKDEAGQEIIGTIDLTSGDELTEDDLPAELPETIVGVELKYWTAEAPEEWEGAPTKVELPKVIDENTRLYAYCTVIEPEVTLDPSLNLKDKIYLQVYVQIPSDAEPSDYSAQIAFESKFQTVDKTVELGDYTFAPVKGNPDKKECRVILVETASAEMSDVATFTVYKGEESVATGNYSVATVVNGMLEKVTAEDRVTLFKTLLQYGHYAQIQFDNNKTELPIPAGTPALTNIPDTYAVSGDPDYAYVKRYPNGNLLDFALELKAAIAMNVYFTPAEGYTMDDFTVTVDGTPATLTKKGDEVFFKITGIDSNKMQTEHTVTVTLKSDASKTATWKRSALNCAYGFQQKDVAKDLVQAMYLYNQAAVVVFPDN